MTTKSSSQGAEGSDSLMMENIRNANKSEEEKEEEKEEEEEH